MKRLVAWINHGIARNSDEGKTPQSSLFVAAGLLSAVLGFGGCADAEAGHERLNWEDGYRWIHVDNVEEKDATKFEDIRKEWLGELRVDERVLGDGRPLFWSGDQRDKRTYWTLYPFQKFGDLDARREMVRVTNEKVGSAATKNYDRCDDFLIAPHFSQLWRRDRSFDFATERTRELTEANASAGRLEWYGEVNVQKETRAVEIWKEIRTALVKADYPLAARAFWSSMGSGELVIFWLAKDSATLRSARTVEEAAGSVLGNDRVLALMTEFKEALALRHSQDVSLRLDLSNLGNPAP